MRITWKRNEFPQFGFGVDLLDGVEVEQRVYDSLAFISQRHDDFSLLIWIGTDWTFERLFADFSGFGEMEIEQEASRIVCGKPARKQVIHIPFSSAEGGFSSSDGSIEFRYVEFPARTKTGLLFEVNGTNMLAIWFIESEIREEYRADEERFFDSFTCAR